MRACHDDEDEREGNERWCERKGGAEREECEIGGYRRRQQRKAREEEEEGKGKYHKSNVHRDARQKERRHRKRRQISGDCLCLRECVFTALAQGAAGDLVKGPISVMKP